MQPKVFNAVRALTEKMARAGQCHFHVSRGREDDVPANLMVSQKVGLFGAQLGLENGVLQGG